MAINRPEGMIPSSNELFQVRDTDSGALMAVLPDWRIIKWKWWELPECGVKKARTCLHPYSLLDLLRGSSGFSLLKEL